MNSKFGTVEVEIGPHSDDGVTMLPGYTVAYDVLRIDFGPHIIDIVKDSGHPEIDNRVYVDHDITVNAASVFQPYLPGEIVRVKWSDELHDI